LQALFLSFPFQFADLTQASAEGSGQQHEPIALGMVFLLHHVGGNSRTAVFAAKSPPKFSRGTPRSAVGKDGGMPTKSIFNQNSTSKTFSGTLVWQQMTIMTARSESLTEIHSWTRLIPPEWRCRVRRLGQLEAPIKSFAGLAAARPGPSLPKQLKFDTFTGNQSKSIRKGHEI
jgi:hypothetical protein